MQNPVASHSVGKTSLRRLWLWLFVLLASLAIWGSFKLDEPVREAVVRTQVKGWKKTYDYRFKTGVRKFGDWPWLMVVGGIGMAISWKLRKREWIRILAAAMLASTIAGLVANASRVTTGRTRPRESPKIQQGFYGPWREGRLTVGDPPFNSFPSGHAATAFGFAAVILYARPWLGIGAIALASLIGLVQHHGGRAPSFRCDRFDLSLALCGVVYLEMDRRKRRGFRAEDPNETPRSVANRE